MQDLPPGVADLNDRLIVEQQGRVPPVRHAERTAGGLGLLIRQVHRLQPSAPPTLIPHSFAPPP